MLRTGTYTLFLKKSGLSFLRRLAFSSLLILLAFSASAQTDTCYRSFFNSFSIPGKISELKDVCRTSDGGYVIGGFLGPVYQQMLVKLNSKAEVLWYKLYSDPAWVNRLVNCGDGNFASASFDAYKSVLSKFTPGGTMLWSKEIKNPGGYAVTVYDMQEASDGSLILICNAAEGTGFTYNYILRFSATGNLIWSKNFDLVLHYPIVKSLLVENNAIYVAADFYDTYAKQRLDIIKLDLNTGSVSWKKRVETDIPKLFQPVLAINNDTLSICATAIYPSNIYEKQRAFIINMDKNTGALLHAYRFMNPELSYNTTYYAIHYMGPLHFAKTYDNQLLLAQLVYFPTDTLINITKFTTSGNVLWSKNYKNLHKHDIWSVRPDKNEILLAGRRYDDSFTGVPNITDLSFLIRLNQNGDITDVPPGNTSLCYNEPATVDIQPAVLTEMSSSNFAGVSNVSFFVITDSPPPTESLTITGNTICYTADSSCRSLSITGPATVCNNNQSQTFTAIRNPGCVNLVKWNVDTSYITVQSQTDSSITVVFRKNGTTTLSAVLSTPCTDIIVYHTVHIYTHAAKLELGPDKQLCFPGSLVLKAQTGYMEYRWNTGATDSLLTVTAPGVYYIDITDSCGNTGADTIRVFNAPGISFSLGADLQKCNTDSLVINAQSGFASYTWGPAYNSYNTAPESFVVFPDRDTSYFVTVIAANGCTGTDTIAVRVFRSPQINLGPDRSVCTGDSLVLSTGAGFQQQQWSTGQHSSVIVVKNTGSYSVVATTAEGCRSFDTLKLISLLPLPTPVLGSDKLCMGETKFLNPGNFSSYLWQDGSINSTFQVSGPGVYAVTVTDANQCKGTDTLVIQNLLPLPSYFLPADTVICGYETIQLKPAGVFIDYLWNTGATTPAIDVAAAGKYWLRVTDMNGCNGKDTLDVQQKECPSGFYMPGGFTPNGDGKNDRIRPVIFGRIKQYKFQIYNRWGEIIFTSSDPLKSWDGNLKSLNQDNAVFLWTCTYQVEGENAQFKKGSFVLIR
jgi:gliding motility-associated-like protein